jgi:hypothetical protein
MAQHLKFEKEIHSSEQIICSILVDVVCCMTSCLILMNAQNSNPTSTDHEQTDNDYTTRAHLRHGIKTQSKLRNCDFCLFLCEL